ncbi:hypothetical protein GR243_16015 [Rhizobium leguminosarum]|uniref:Uncharacterized protein n=1 Tax=Rhizobium leguminosarum TaxID=384 RepID=A0A6P0D515_RHILE|nr:hypothetical protein [Rhizobium leguminosarum]NEK47999.1 hypothetical protein [Rhizobium leguminosarum]
MGSQPPPSPEQEPSPGPSRARPHGSLKSKTPISRLGLNRDNLLRIHT